MVLFDEFISVLLGYLLWYCLYAICVSDLTKNDGTVNDDMINECATIR